ncbi:hypothetical protein [Cohnella abietis]|uniref:Flagellar protein FliT n=1 Tax=Cohnella abietis TaxID=2507935 RepID=A0A3T1DDH7_9BACL|nr:hypothetical protein [Cohnella abietis]BBI36139.1 hypothetical protein KCTCHS21_55380 [Cohnella abietis]
MNQDGQSLKQFIMQLSATSEQILSLDLEEEDDISRLEALQLEQEVLKQQIESLMLTSDVSHTDIQDLLHDAYYSEVKVNQKLTLFKEFISDHLSKVQEGSRMKNAYHQAYSQAEGYFVDNKK